ncbi:MAG: hypothetical protein ACR2IQ_02550, partial [Minisyncoccia bacterium]
STSSISMTNQNLLKFFQDPEWHLVEEMLSKKTEPLRDVSTIDISQSAETIKAIIAGRQETLKLIDDFKQEVELTKTINNNNKTPTSFA